MQFECNERHYIGNRGLCLISVAHYFQNSKYVVAKINEIQIHKLYEVIAWIACSTLDSMMKTSLLQLQKCTETKTITKKHISLLTMMFIII